MALTFPTCGTLGSESFLRARKKKIHLCRAEEQSPSPACTEEEGSVLVQFFCLKAQHSLRVLPAMKRRTSRDRAFTGGHIAADLENRAETERGKRTGREGERGQDSGRRDFAYNFSKSEEESVLQNIQAYVKELPVLLHYH